MQTPTDNATFRLSIGERWLPVIKAPGAWAVIEGVGLVGALIQTAECRKKWCDHSASLSFLWQPSSTAL